MSRYSNVEEVRKQHIESMGEELGTIFHALSNEMTWIYTKWNQYVELFGNKPSRIDLMNDAAPLFFRIVQDSLFEDTLIHIARLIDRPEYSPPKPNLTIRRLPGLVIDEELKENIEGLIEIALTKADFCIDWRNRHIAHKDLNLALNEGVEPLKPASREKVSAVLGAITKVMNTVSTYYMDTTIMFGGIPSPHGAVALLYVIDDGLQIGKEREERLKAGQYRPADHKPRDL